jgi:hypothetical protein
MKRFLREKNFDAEFKGFHEAETFLRNQQLLS